MLNSQHFKKNELCVTVYFKLFKNNKIKMIFFNIFLLTLQIQFKHDKVLLIVSLIKKNT